MGTCLHTLEGGSEAMVMSLAAALTGHLLARLAGVGSSHPTAPSVPPDFFLQLP